MWRSLAVWMLVCLSVTSAFAAERVLINPQNLKVSPLSRGTPPAALTALRATAAESGRVSVIVGLRVPFAAEGLLASRDKAEQRAEIAAATSAVRARFDASIRRSPQAIRSFETIPFMSLEVTPEELERLAADPDVISLSKNLQFRPSLAQSVPMIQGDQAHEAGFTGTGMAVAVFDTGVDKNHSFLSGRVIAEACFSTNDILENAVSLCPGGATRSTAPGSAAPCSLPGPGCDHGTHVAGIAAGFSTAGPGVAPRAGIIAVQVFSNVSGEPRTFFVDVLAGLEHVYGLRNSFPIAAVNMSLGGYRYTSTAACDAAFSAMKTAIDNLRAVGIATVVASGNESFEDALSAPACISSAISVGAVAVRNSGNCRDRNGSSPTARDKVACFSNSASFLSLLAPGYAIRSSVPGNRFATYSGTSMAAPHVAGAWAVLKQKAPSASVTQVLSALQTTGTSVTDYRNGIVKPRINVKAALDQLSGNSPVLSFSKTGTGQGSVTFSPAGTRASCTTDCANAYAMGTEVTLTAEPAQGSVFSGWSGACSGTAACTLTMSEARQVTARFASTTTDVRVLSYTKQGSGPGTVVFAAMGNSANCSGNCTLDFSPSSVVTLQPVVPAGSVFKGWSGACRGSRKCKIKMSSDKSVTALFEEVPVVTLSVSYNTQGTNLGTISFVQPDGVAACNGNCTKEFSEGQKVRLTAQASSGYRFIGWGGSCSGRRKCTVTMTADRTVTASFEAIPDYDLTLTIEGEGTVSFIKPEEEPVCTATCVRPFDEKTKVKLRAEAAEGYRFAGWRESCRKKRTCSVTMSGPKAVTAVFSAIQTASNAGRR
jgi:subtilisin family serine protease